VAAGVVTGPSVRHAHLPPPDPVVEPDPPVGPSPEPDDEDDPPVPPGSGEPPVDLPGREPPAPPMRAG
jgi:hypothetical protein